MSESFLLYTTSQVWEYDIFTLVFYFHFLQLKPIWLLVFYLPKKKGEALPPSPQPFEEHSSASSNSALSFPDMY